MKVAIGLGGSHFHLPTCKVTKAPADYYEVDSLLLKYHLYTALGRRFYPCPGCLFKKGKPTPELKVIIQGWTDLDSKGFPFGGTPSKKGLSGENSLQSIPKDSGPFKAEPNRRRTNG